MIKKSLLSRRSFFIISMLLFAIMVILSLFSIADGTFAPLQTSLVTEIGICTSEGTVNPVKIIPYNTELLFICGTVAGETKKSFSIVMFHEEQHIFSTSDNYPPGEFFVPVNAQELRNSQTVVFLPGNYRVGIRYSNPIALESTFQVSNE